MNIMKLPHLTGEKKPTQEFGNKNKGGIASTNAISHKNQTFCEKGGNISSTTSSRKHKGGIPSTITIRDSDRNTASVSNSRVPNKTFLDQKSCKKGDAEVLNEVKQY